VQGGRARGSGQGLQQGGQQQLQPPYSGQLSALDVWQEQQQQWQQQLQQQQQRMRAAPLPFSPAQDFLTAPLPLTGHSGEWVLFTLLSEALWAQVYMPLTGHSGGWVPLKW